MPRCIYCAAFLVPVERFDRLGHWCPKCENARLSDESAYVTQKDGSGSEKLKKGAPRRPGPWK